MSYGAGLLRLGRTKWAGNLVGWVFAHMSFALPVQRLRETDSLLAFYHPQPAYPVHILIVPKQSAASLLDLDANDGNFLKDLLRVTQELVRELGLDARGYRLVANGGAYQDIKQVHFHLIAG